MDYPYVNTTHGMIVGQWRQEIAIFRGIPYGGRVDRERRWMTALPAQNWEGVRDCTKNGPTVSYTHLTMHNPWKKIF